MPKNKITNKSLDEIMTKNLRAQRSQVLTAVPLALCARRIEKGVLVSNPTYSILRNDWPIMVDQAIAVNSLRPDEYEVVCSTAPVVNARFARYGVNVSGGMHDLFLVAAMTLSPKFKKRGEIVQDVRFKGVSASRHTGPTVSRARINKTDVFRIEMNGGALYAYVPNNYKVDMLGPIRRSMYEGDFKPLKPKDTLVLPNIILKEDRTFSEILDVRLNLTEDKDFELEADGFHMHTEFCLDHVGAKVRQVVRMTKTRSAERPKEYVIKSPFVVSIVREGQELFSAYCAKDTWLKSSQTK